MKQLNIEGPMSQLIRVLENIDMPYDATLTVTINGQPSKDESRPIICKTCYHYDPNGWCHKHAMPARADGYCGYWKNKDAC